MSGAGWIVSYVLLWIAVVVLSLAVVALLRQIGVLHARLRPQGVHFAGEGPPLDSPASDIGGVEWDRARLTVVAFTAPDCELCEALVPGLAALGEQYREVQVATVDHQPATRRIFSAYNVTSTPYVVAVDDDGIVRGRGVANTLDQVEVLVEEALGEDGVARGG